jgi:hypothetical protein
MKRASYREAVEWIARNDDTEWLNEIPQYASVTACLVADLFGVDEDRVFKDLRRALIKQRAERAAIRLALAPNRIA